MSFLVYLFLIVIVLPILLHAHRNVAREGQPVLNNIALIALITIANSINTFAAIGLASKEFIAGNHLGGELLIVAGLVFLTYSIWGVRIIKLDGRAFDSSDRNSLEDPA